MADKIKTLSQAIKLGATFHPQAFLKHWMKDSSGNIIATCALGAAIEACGIPTEGSVIDAVEALIDKFSIDRLVTDRIAAQNDVFRWTREHIADKLEQQGL